MAPPSVCWRDGSVLRLLRRMEERRLCQVIMATHSPLLMAYPGAQLLLLTKYSLAPVSLDETEHCRLTRDFCMDPAAFVESALDDDA